MPTFVTWHLMEKRLSETFLRSTATDKFLWTAVSTLLSDKRTFEFSLYYFQVGCSLQSILYFFLPSDPMKKFDYLFMLKQNQLLGNDSPSVGQNILAIADKLLGKECVTKNQKERVRRKIFIRGLNNYQLRRMQRSWFEQRSISVAEASNGVNPIFTCNVRFTFQSVSFHFSRKLPSFSAQTFRIFMGHIRTSINFMKPWDIF